MNEGGKGEIQKSGIEMLEAHVSSVRMGMFAMLHRSGGKKEAQAERKKGRKKGGKAGGTEVQLNNDKISLITIDELIEGVNERIIDILIAIVGSLIISKEEDGESNEKSFSMATLSVFAYKGEEKIPLPDEIEQGDLKAFIDTLNEIKNRRREFFKIMCFNLFGSQVVLSPPDLEIQDKNKVRIVKLK